jgi:hypothetical protein
MKRIEWSQQICYPDLDKAHKKAWRNCQAFLTYSETRAAEKGK